MCFPVSPFDRCQPVGHVGRKSFAVGRFLFAEEKIQLVHAVTSPDRHQPPSAGSSDDLKGLDILLVEDSRDVGEAVKKHLELLGAKVAGPATTTAEADGLLTEHLPDVALVDFHLREGERSDGLIARLHEQGIPVIILSGSFEFPPLPSVRGATFLQKPVSEAQLLAHLSPLIAKKATR
jgi:CheY-like chemotaxis protein